MVHQAAALINKLQVNPWFPVSSLRLESLRLVAEKLGRLRYEYPWYDWQREGKLQSRLAHILLTEILQIQPDHTNRVWHSYFRGEAPFRKPRDKQDLPDAYIAQAVIDQAQVASYAENVYFISADKRLEILEEHPRLIVLDKLDRLFARDELS